MRRLKEYNSHITGAVTGVVVPVMILLLFYLWKSESTTIAEFFIKISTMGILTNAISASVFANVFVFLLFNRLDMLKASRGVLGITILWALIVFIIKLG